MTERRYIIEIVEAHDGGVFIRRRDECGEQSVARVVGEKLLSLLPLHQAKPIFAPPKTIQ